MPHNNFDDVKAFAEKFGLPSAEAPAFLDHKTQQYREDFMQEELTEFNLACQTHDMHGAADALVDLVYVAMGTAIMMGLDWQALWDEVQRANMSKVRAAHSGESKRQSSLDVVKPEGWRGPDHSAALGQAQGFNWPTVLLTPQVVSGPDGAYLPREEAQKDLFAGV